MAVLRRPNVLLVMIIDELGYYEKIALSVTCKRIGHMLPPPRPGSVTADKAASTLDALRKIELWPCYTTWSSPNYSDLLPRTKQDYYVCASCVRIRDCIHFTNKMLLARPKGLENSQLLLRRCMDCTSINCIPQGHEEIERILVSGSMLPFGGHRVPGLPELENAGWAMCCVACHRFKRIQSFESGMRRLHRCTSCVDKYESIVRLAGPMKSIDELTETIKIVMMDYIRPIPKDMAYGEALDTWVVTFAKRLKIS